MPSLFERQLATYASYHRDHRNRLTHFVGIPAIVLSILVALASWRFGVGGLDLSAAYVAALLAAIGWIMLDRTVGLAMLVALVPMLVVAEWLARTHSVTTVWWTFAVLFVGGWAFQLVGHGFEGRRPALADNLFQAFIGPMFIAAEALEALGLRRPPSEA
jgi:uncharacterized membrane protein YGL010W